MISTLSAEAVRDAYIALEAEAAMVGLKIIEHKTGNRTNPEAGQTVAFDDRNFGVVNEFVYLEALVTPENEVGLEIQRRSKLQIGASAACENICGHLTWNVRQSLRSTIP
jgi:hypothetical protein